MDADFDVHLEGQKIEVEVVGVPTQQAPSGLLCRERISTRVRISRDSIRSIVCSLHEDAIINIWGRIIDNLAGNCEGKTLHEAAINSISHVKRQGRLVINFDGLLPEELENIHHGKDVLAHWRTCYDLSGVVNQVESDWAEG